ncbi:LCP family protein [Phosphitispora fastidiosa]|uniref:LCP family protein n=1 Tax=Phosphitispora fastidiosa TaxID=2837202 RepID=UPI001E4E62EA|nr:LCP family protein [Phosphitispora fastidiosa]MBU7008156.1 hypothetical protein [Phosphitispora fastidiosa]
MKRINHRLPVMVSRIFVSTLMAALAVFFLHNGGMGAAFVKGSAGAMPFFKGPGEAAPLLKGPGAAVLVKVPPEEGHWLKTADDGWYVPAIQGIKGSRGNKVTPLVPIKEAAMPTVVHLEAAQTALNCSADTLNIMYIWTDEDKLKVVSVTTFNRETKQASIVVIPLYTATDTNETIELNRDYRTIGDLYRENGREGVRRFLEQKLGLEISNFVHVNQTALEKLSDVIGIIEVNGRRSSMLEAFEQTTAGLRTDDRDIVSAVACKLVQPRILTRVPEFLRIFSRDMTTNFTTGEMLAVFYLSRQMELQEMRKTALAGYEYESPGSKYLFVSEQTWKNIIYEMTQ